HAPHLVRFAAAYARRSRPLARRGMAGEQLYSTPWHPLPLYRGPARSRPAGSACDGDLPHHAGVAHQRRASRPCVERRYNARRLRRRNHAARARQRLRLCAGRPAQAQLVRFGRAARTRLSPRRRNLRGHRAGQRRYHRGANSFAARGSDRMIRIVIADDHTIVREGLKQVLAAAGDLTLVAEAKNGGEVMQRVREFDFDVLLLDMSMPGKSGIELIKQVHGEKPKLRILVLSMHEEEQYAVRALKAGAAGYLTKESASDLLIAAIRKVAAGGAYITPV